MAAVVLFFISVSSQCAQKPMNPGRLEANRVDAERTR